MFLFHALEPKSLGPSFLGGDGWLIGFAGSSITAVTFLGVAAALAVSLTRTRQWQQNPLGVATFLIFAACGGGHLIHSLQLMYLWFGIHSAVAEAARVHYSDWHLWVTDGATALAGLTYWTLRKKFPHLVSGAAVYEDLRSKHRDALEIHDNVVQGLVQAKMSLDLDQDLRSKEAMDETLAASKRILDDLIGTRASMRFELPGQGADPGEAHG